MSRMEWFNLFDSKTLAEATELVNGVPNAVEPVKVLIRDHIKTLYARVRDGERYTVKIQLGKDPSDYIMSCDCKEGKLSGLCPHMAAVLFMFSVQEKRLEKKVSPTKKNQEADRFEEDDDVIDLMYQISERSLQSFVMYLLQTQPKFRLALQNFIERTNASMEYHPEFHFNDYWIMIEAKYTNLNYETLSRDFLNQLKTFITKDFTYLIHSLLDHGEIELAYHLTLSFFRMIEADFIEFESSQSITWNYSIVTEPLFSLLTVIVERNSKFRQFLFDITLNIIGKFELTQGTSFKAFNWLCHCFYEVEYQKELQDTALKLLKQAKIKVGHVSLDSALSLYVSTCLHLDEVDKAIEVVETFSDLLIAQMLMAKLFILKGQTSQAIEIAQTVNTEAFSNTDADEYLYTFWIDLCSDFDSLFGHSILKPSPSYFKLVYDKWSVFGDPFNYPEITKNIEPQLIKYYENDILHIFYSYYDMQDSLANSGQFALLFDCLVKTDDIERFHQYFNVLKEHYPKELKDIYKQLIENQLASSQGGRTHYATYGRYLKDLFQLEGGRAWAKKIAMDLSKKYPNRYAMIEELQAIFDN